ncbi:MAG: hypothetical protein CL783_01215 [Chloroflexi bacterium]|nr:hypothetical protein [Chloroflexota bacterium]|tara:strand:- start:23765 stop:24745 length:981 start_codon:yes stop_codon:yes gene_type:complete
MSDIRDHLSNGVPTGDETWAQLELSSDQYRKKANQYRLRYLGRASGFLAPYMILWFAFLAIPVGWAIFLSFNEGGVLDSGYWVGLENWGRAFDDSELTQVVLNTSLFVVLAITIVFGLAIFLASLINNHRRGENFFKVTLYFPLLAPPILGAMIWHFMLHFDFGIVNLITRGIFGWEGVNFLGKNPIALFSIIAVEIWRGLGFWVLFYLAGLQSVPGELLEAAKLDGARSFRRFIRISVPVLRPLFLFALVIAIIMNFQLFDSVKILTDGGPRMGTATIVWFIYRRMFAFQDTGLAFSASVGLLIGTMVLTLLVFWLLGRRSKREA